MRDALQAVLREALGPRTALELDAPVSTVRAANGGGAEIVFADGTARRFDLVAGCDGVRGATRGSARPPAEPLAVLGKRIRIRWGVAATASRRPRDELHQWFGPGGVYCLAGSYGGLDGREYDQCVVVSPAPPGAAARGDAWDDDASAATREAMVSQLRAAGAAAAWTIGASRRRRGRGDGWTAATPWSRRRLGRGDA